jgi:hypothetical protein
MVPADVLGSYVDDHRVIRSFCVSATIIFFFESSRTLLGYLNSFNADPTLPFPATVLPLLAFFSQN